MCRYSTTSAPRVPAHQDITKIDDSCCSDYALNYEDIPEYVETSSCSDTCSTSCESIGNSYNSQEPYLMNESMWSIHDNNTSSYALQSRKETQRSEKIPLPSSHIRRTESEIQLSEDLMFAEAKDLQMFNRLHAGLSQHNSFNPYLQKDVIERIVKSRIDDVENTPKSCFISLEKSDESTSNNNFDDDCIFEMDL